MPHLSRLAAALSLALLATTSVYAQMARVAPSAAPRPAPGAVAAQASPNPAGLRPQVPAGLTSGSGAAASTDATIATTAPTGGSYTPGVDVTATAAAATAVMGAGGARGPAQYLGSGNPGFSAIDIARSFIAADVNGDGELTEAEARRLSISMMTFQEMDRNFDGRVSRAEYEDSLR
jgi:hypothetical protein